MTMKNIFLFLFVLFSFACWAQPGSLSHSVYRTRVNDSTAAKSANTSPHSNGYADLWWNNQASPAQWMFWNGSNYERFSSFTTGLPYWPLTGNFSTGGSQTITLGGGMNIDAGTFSFQLGGIFDGTQLIYDDANSLITINSQSLAFEINGAAGYIVWGDNANAQGITLGNGAGLEYDADYSGSYTDRSIVDKGYVDLNSGQVTTVSISSAEILALNSTPKTLISAPGAGKFIQIISISSSLDFVSAAYATNTTVWFRYGTGGQLINDISWNISPSEDRLFRFKTVTDGTGTAIANVVNQPVVAEAQTGDPTTGDGTAKVYITYRIIDL